MAKRLEDGRIQVNDGRIFDQFQIQMLIVSYLTRSDENDPSLEVVAEILRDCHGPSGQTGLMDISGYARGSLGPMNISGQSGC